MGKSGGQIVVLLIFSIMNIEELRAYCLSKPAVSEGFPFDEQTLVFKVGGKIFLLTDLADDLAMNIKNTPDKVLAMREAYPCVWPGYHMNKDHWNTVHMDGSVPDSLLLEWIDDSYQLVFDSLTRKVKDGINKGL